MAQMYEESLIRHGAIMRSADQVPKENADDALAHALFAAKYHCRPNLPPGILKKVGPPSENNLIQRLITATNVLL